MIRLRRADERGHANHGWLDSYHTFSFAEYYDPAAMGFRALRVINEDRVAPGKGFGTHPHRDMEIVTYVVEGSLAHRDSLGNGSSIIPGDVQRMSAGTGITHSEFNGSASEPVHLLQIWLLPLFKDLAPSYEQKHFTVQDRSGRWQLLASPTGEHGEVTVHSPVYLYATMLAAGESLDFALKPGRAAWLQVISGTLTLGDHQLGAGDAAAVEDESGLQVRASETSHALLFDLGNLPAKA